ncbi:cyanophycinase [Acetonema longum DSM 6540]|uniref:Cyanophycinase n=2 Tax=Acetonema TaxID=2373 RepID=F7NIK2_9FIRM|nr:cyanophycinase [Acetonema longum DSM 6540]
MQFLHKIPPELAKIIQIEKLQDKNLLWQKEKLAMGKGEGDLLVIGGNEDKQGDCLILRHFLALAQGREAAIAVITTATEYPREVGSEYRSLFLNLGAVSCSIIYIDDRETANDRCQAGEIDSATGIFITGGDQLRLTSILGGTRADEAIRRAHARGAVIAGTSAGASVMSNTMIVEGDSSDTPKKSSLSMAHGMGLLTDVVIDQHFAQRGRMNRILAAVAQNPFVLGVGIDEDTALLVNPQGRSTVVGTQTVTIADGKQILHSNISESQPNDPLALTNVLLHILPAGFGFDIRRRQPFMVEDR